MYKYYKKSAGYFLFVLLAMLFLLGEKALCVEISIPGISGQPGHEIQVPIQIDTVDNLAGVKIVMKYEKTILRFKEAVKTRKTASLLHVVNDKKPGILIVVMAGARGIKGKNIPILQLTFALEKDLKNRKKTTIQITESQLMSDKLKELKHTINVKPIQIGSVVDSGPEKKQVPATNQSPEKKTEKAGSGQNEKKGLVSGKKESGDKTVSEKKGQIPEDAVIPSSPESKK